MKHRIPGYWLLRHRYRLYLVMVVLCCMGTVGRGQPFTFQKVNSGTRSEIRSILPDQEKGFYFLTDKIYKLDGSSWKKLDFAVEGKIHTFYPVSAQDIWFTLIPFTSTCMLYHFHDGITENIRTPFTNYITAISFSDPNRGVFASIADLAVYENGQFRMLPPSPARYNICSIFGSETTAIWIMTESGEFFRYAKGAYKKFLEHKVVICFSFNDEQNGFVLAGDELYRITGGVISLMEKHPDLQLVAKIRLLPDGGILMVGKQGLVMQYTNGKLVRLPAPCTESLTDLAISDTDQIWISGRNGRLLYSGTNTFSEFAEDNQGFASHKLSSVGLSSDGEYGIAMADFNDDGKQDIYTVRIYEQNRLYINKLMGADQYSSTNGMVEEVGERAATGAVKPGKNPPENELKMGIGVADIDNDDDQDIYLCYLNGSNRMLLNRGNGYFRNVSEQENRACLDMQRSNAAVFSDVDNDGDLDMFITSELASNRLFENDGTGHFTDITSSSGLASPGGGMCASFADVNNDGLPDLCVSFWYPSNKLFLNASAKGNIRFRDITTSTDLAKAAPSKSNAVVFADVNNDGMSDLFIANRNTGNKLYINAGNGVFTDRTSIYFQPENTLSNGAVFADFDLDGYLDLYITNVGENVFYKNMNGLGFKDITAGFGAELSGYCTGCVSGDVDNDGDPDLYAANYINGNSALFLNITEKKRYLKILLKGVKSNTDAIGTKVWLYKTGGAGEGQVLAGYRELTGGGGYCSASTKEIIFGLGQGAGYYLRVKFPSSSDTLKIDPVIEGKTIIIHEMTGFAAFYTESRNSVVRFLTDREKQPEILKFMIVFLLLIVYNLKMRQNVWKIDLIRWLASGAFFIVFAFVNRFFLFQWPAVPFFIAPVIVLILVALEHLFISRILLRRLARKDKLELREKLSRDLHDDLASTLGSISIYAETFKAMKEPSANDFKTLTVKIAGLTQAALESVSDIIWMTSPQHDTLQSLFAKTNNYMLDILTDNKINFLSENELPDAPVIMQEKLRNDTFMILKEGLHNIITHSGAGNVRLSAETRDNICIISLKDDGVGISEPRPQRSGSHGNGLLNMKKRANESGIEFSLRSGAGEGTEIILQFKI